jgi:RNA polymerase sigma factor (sigma-70 family)
MQCDGVPAPAHTSERRSDEASTLLSADNVREVRLLYQRHWAELCGYLRKRFGAGPPEPQDVAQETFLRYAANRSGSEIRNERAYLFKIARNVLVEDRRRIAARRIATARLSGVTASADELTPERQLIGTEHLDILRRVIDIAPEVRRQSFTLNRFYGLPCAEIARRTGYSESAIKKHVNVLLAELELTLKHADQRRARLSRPLVSPSAAAAGVSS